MVQKVEWKQIIDNTENYILSKTNIGAGTVFFFFVKTEIKNSKIRSSYDDKKEEKNNP